MDLSVIIVSHNVKDILKKCVISIYENSLSTEFEVIVVDNASSDGTVELVKRDFPGVRIVENIENKGFSIANNQGIKISKGDLILLLNSDTVLFPGSIDKIVNFMKVHSRAGAVGPKLLNPDGSFQISFWSFPGLASEFMRKILNIFIKFRFFRNFLEEIYNKEREVDWVTGACLMTRRKVIENVGGLDENFFMYFEDVDWCYRIRMKGWKIYFLPMARIIHFIGKSVEKEKQKNIQNYRQSRMYFYRKHKKFYI